jgi:hypothetical protein
MVSERMMGPRARRLSGAAGEAGEAGEAGWSREDDVIRLSSATAGQLYKKMI